MTMTINPFPKLSQAWRVARIAGATFGAAALSGFAHLHWPPRTALVAVAVAAGEAAYRKALPSGKLAGMVANLVAAYRQITAAAKPIETAIAETTTVQEAAPAPPAVVESVPAAPETPALPAA